MSVSILTLLFMAMLLWNSRPSSAVFNAFGRPSAVKVCAQLAIRRLLSALDVASEHIVPVKCRAPKILSARDPMQPYVLQPANRSSQTMTASHHLRHACSDRRMLSR